MRGLYISIIFTVLSALFFIGWGLDKLADHAVPETHNEQENSGTQLYRKLVEGLAQQLNEQSKEQLSDSINTFQKQYEIDTHLVNSNDIALPVSLRNGLSEFGGLLLASPQNQYLLKEITSHPNYYLQINFPLESEENHPFNFLLTLALYTSICGILILWVFPLSRRLFLLNNAAAKIGEGQLTIRIKPSRFSYISMLENSFNNMANQIEKLVADNKILARSLSHDIRTPIACLRFGLEAAQDCKTLEKKNSYLLRMESELSNMEDMTSAFLEYASMERQALRLNKQNINVHELVASAINDCQILAQQKSVKIKMAAVSPQIHHFLDYHWCYRALVNIISNAIGYANKDVLVSLTNTNGLQITVEDDGKGIDDTQLKNIFTPFVKLDAERSRDQGHFGLGLAVCTKVMDWHQGTICVVNRQKLAGASFTLIFPTNKRKKERTQIDRH